MMDGINAKAEQGLVMDIYTSFRSLPVWVQIWVMLILMPINMASLLFLFEPGGMLIAFLANIAMMLNLPVMLKDRGFSKRMALPHLIPWTILIAILVFAPPVAEGNYAIFLKVLLVTNIISLLFDFPDAVKWMRGDRTAAGR
jgi:hypothetical protein